VVFVFDFVTNFLLSLTLKEFWKSVNIWWSYGQELGVLFFFDSQCRYVLCWHWAFMSFFHHIHVYNNIIMITVFFLMSAETCMNIVKINILFLNYPVNEDWWLYWQASKRHYFVSYCINGESVLSGKWLCCKFLWTNHC